MIPAGNVWQASNTSVLMALKIVMFALLTKVQGRTGVRFAIIFSREDGRFTISKL
jgi:hypothetical protein